MVRDDNHGLGEKAHALRFHDRGDAGHCLARAHHMIEQGCAFLNGAPDHVFLMRTQFDGLGRAHQFKVGTVIGRGHMRIEPLVVEFRKHVAPFVIGPDPIEKCLADFVGLLHGGGGQFLVDDHDVVATFVFLPTRFLNLDGFVCEQGFNDFVRRIFGYAPDARDEGGVPDAD